MIYFVFYQTAVMLSCVALSLLLVMVWRYRRIHGGSGMIAMIVTVFLWSLFTFVETNAPTLETQSLFFKFWYTAMMAVPPTLLIFAVNYTHGENILTGARIIPLFVVPLGIVTVLWNPSWSHLISANEHLVQSGEFLLTVREWGPVLWITTAYNWVQLIVAVALLFTRMFKGLKLYRGQAILLLAAILIPLAWNIIYVFDILNLPQKDLAPVAFTVSVVLVAFGLMRFNLFMVLPYARQYLMNHMNDGLIVLGAENHLLEVNPSARNLLDLQNEEIGRPVEMLPALYDVFKRLTKSETGVITLTLTICNKERELEIESIKIRDKQGYKIGLMIVIHDITERVQMQEQINAQNRLASIGKLTSGVAHEINNPLAIIKGLAELLIESEIDETVREDVVIINNEVDRANEIVNNLITFARRQPGDKQPLDINAIIRRTLELRIYEQNSNRVRIECTLSDFLPKVMGNEIQLRQVFVNIIENAEYFMSEGSQEAILSITTSRTKDGVVTRITDNGPGIKPKDAGRVFEPFFTTKRLGEGTGLGLSICYGIITEHGGTVTMETGPGEGTTFVIVLPAVPTEEIEMSNFYLHKLPESAATE